MLRKRTILVLSAIVALALFGVSASAHAAKPDKCPATGCIARPADTLSLYNGRLAIQQNPDNAKFNIGALPNANGGYNSGSSYDLSFSWPSSPWSSYSTVRVDGTDYYYGASGALTLAPTNNGSALTSAWQMGDVEVTQSLSIVPNPQTGLNDTARIAYTLRNKGTAAHSAGMRALIDDEVNYNDGALFRIPGQSDIQQTERELIGADVPSTISAFYNLNDSQHVGVATFSGNGATAPDRLLLAGWDNAYHSSSIYDYQINPSSDFKDDSSYILYWNPASLAPNEARTYVTYYGLAQLVVDLTPPLGLGVAGPSTITITNGAYAPFQVTATVQDTGTGPAQNVALSLNLPAGLTLVSGSATQSVGDLAVGQQKQATWTVQGPAVGLPRLFLYSASAAASNTPGKTVARPIVAPNYLQMQLRTRYDSSLDLAAPVFDASLSLNNLTASTIPAGTKFTFRMTGMLFNVSAAKADPATLTGGATLQSLTTKQAVATLDTALVAGESRTLRLHLVLTNPNTAKTLGKSISLRVATTGLRLNNKPVSFSSNSVTTTFGTANTGTGSEGGQQPLAVKLPKNGKASSRAVVNFKGTFFAAKELSALFTDSSGVTKVVTAKVDGSGKVNFNLKGLAAGTYYVTLHGYQSGVDGIATVILT